MSRFPTTVRSKTGGGARFAALRPEYLATDARAGNGFVSAKSATLLLSSSPFSTALRHWKPIPTGSKPVCGRPGSRGGSSSSRAVLATTTSATGSCSSCCSRSPGCARKPPLSALRDRRAAVTAEQEGRRLTLRAAPCGGLLVLLLGGEDTWLDRLTHGNGRFSPTSRRARPTQRSLPMSVARPQPSTSTSRTSTNVSAFTRARPAWPCSRREQTRRRPDPPRDRKRGRGAVAQRLTRERQRELVQRRPAETVFMAKPRRQDARRREPVCGHEDA